MRDPKQQRELLAVQTLKELGVVKISKRKLAMLLASFCAVATQEKQRCIEHVRYCEKRFSLNQPALPNADATIVTHIVAESLEFDLV